MGAGGPVPAWVQRQQDSRVGGTVRAVCRVGAGGTSDEECAAMRDRGIKWGAGWHARVMACALLLAVAVWPASAQEAA